MPFDPGRLLLYDFNQSLCLLSRWAAQYPARSVITECLNRLHVAHESREIVGILPEIKCFFR
jgi:hypothetical protein